MFSEGHDRIVDKIKDVLRCHPMPTEVSEEPSLTAQGLVSGFQNVTGGKKACFVSQISNNSLLLYNRNYGHWFPMDLCVVVFKTNFYKWFLFADVTNLLLQGQYSYH